MEKNDLSSFSLQLSSFSDETTVLWLPHFLRFLGNFVGPTIAGFTVEHFGFQATTDGFVISFILMLLVNIFELLRSSRNAMHASKVEIT